MDVERVLPATYKRDVPAKTSGTSSSKPRSLPSSPRRGAHISAARPSTTTHKTRSRAWEQQDLNATLYQVDFCRRVDTSSLEQTKSMIDVQKQRKQLEGTSDWALLADLESTIVAAERRARQQAKLQQQAEQRTFLDSQVGPRPELLGPTVQLYGASDNKQRAHDCMS